MKFQKFWITYKGRENFWSASVTKDQGHNEWKNAIDFKMQQGTTILSLIENN